MVHKESVYCLQCNINEKYEFKAEPLDHQYEKVNILDEAIFVPIHVAEIELMKHMKICDLEAWEEFNKIMIVEETKPTPIINNHALVPKKTQYKNFMDDRPKFSINMGYTKYIAAQAHLELVMNKGPYKMVGGR